ncbi:hypothetical protein [Streptomyces camelliae]|uniref:Uncharacterized protein n=1 Tax=Streptomyces camelliae TaxID=3004093 RepID=A0ABY7PDN9_9ACTN|nr:hypothetical protein [Streptomyces sp. HUAS 2-6]WBO68716.1 hypothetical protein O1G22_40895 [Streptomyces sp. HUAS 2-6]
MCRECPSLCPFAHHVLLSLSVHRDRCPALVWPPPPPPPLLRALRGPARAAASLGRFVPAGPEAEHMRSVFATALKTPVNAAYLGLPAAATEAPTSWAFDAPGSLLLIVLHGSLLARLHPPQPSPAPDTTLWLHTIEVLYVPRSYRLSLTHGPAAALLLCLSFDTARTSV